jgi:hypothetical protein
MFEKLTIKQTYSKPLNVGQLLEAIIFYEKVELVVDSTSMKSIFNDFNLLSFLYDLIKHRKLNVHFINGLYTICGMKNEGLFISTIESDWKLPGPVIDTEPNISDSLHRNLIIDFWEETSLYRNLANRDFLKDDVKNDFIFSASIISVLEYYFPELSNFDNLYLLTDRIYQNDNPEIFSYELVFDEKITNDPRIENIEMLISNPVSAIIDANVNIEMASRFNSDFLSQTIYDSLLETKINRIFKNNTNKFKSDQKLFQSIVVNDIKSIEEAINNNHKTFDDYLKLYNQSYKFKEWLTKVPKDQSALNQYISEINSDKWFEKLPVKGLRWSIFTGLGIAIDLLGAGGIGTISGMAVSATDAFYLDKILKGWNPNLYIKGNLNEFLTNKKLPPTTKRSSCPADMR